MNSDEESPTGGLWSSPAIPKRGWVCDDVTDLGDQRQLCAMCGRVWVRFLHGMVHADWPDRVQTGRVCASHLEDDPTAAQRRETQARRRAQATDFEPEWRWSDAGNPWFKTKEGRCTVFPDRKRDGHWKYVINGRDDKPHFGRTSFPSQKEAMAAAAKIFVATF